SSMDECC
ncbi:glycosyl transferases group 1 family protein, partial [Vibrio harveyi]